MFSSHKYHNKQLLTAAVYYDIGKKSQSMFSMGRFPEIYLYCLPCYSNDDYIQHCNNGPCMIQHMHGNKIKYNSYTYCNVTNKKQYNYNIKHFFLL